MFDKHKHIIIGYGSLLSHDSRLRHSDINAESVPVSIEGYQRAWITRSSGEKQTYVGAKASAQSVLNGVLLPIEEISPELQVREQDYRFVAVELTQVSLHFDHHHLEHMEVLSEKSIWLCESLGHQQADQHHPVYQSYIDTCIQGCLETGARGFAEEFVRSTHFWEDYWVNDRSSPRYPRYARLTKQQQDRIDEVLHRCGVLHLRKEQ